MMKALLALTCCVALFVGVSFVNKGGKDTNVNDSTIKVEDVRPILKEFRYLINMISNDFDGYEEGGLSISKCLTPDVLILNDLYQVVDSYREGGTPMIELSNYLSLIANQKIDHNFEIKRELFPTDKKKVELDSTDKVFWVTRTRENKITGKKDETELIFQFYKKVTNKIVIKEIDLFSDEDGDGVENNWEDKCPDDEGFSNTAGCPDDDRDGVINSEDDCPNDRVDPKINRFKGCPDRDKDKVVDEIDKCPDVFGSKENGCPNENIDLEGVEGTKKEPEGKKTIEEIQVEIIDGIYDNPKSNNIKKIEEFEKRQRHFANQWKSDSTNSALWDFLFWVVEEYKVDFKNKQEKEEKPTNPEFTSFRSNSKDMVQVIGGKFLMGCKEKDKSKGCISDNIGEASVKVNNFYIDPFEVTNAQYVKFLNQYKSDTVKKGRPFEGKALLSPNQTIIYSDNIWKVYGNFEDHPVVNVTWYGANEYAEYYNLSLPTEAEWEFAARGGKTQVDVKYSGDSSKYSIDTLAVYEKNSDRIRSATVGSKMPNALQVYDLTGNVYEWCSDYYKEKAYKMRLKNDNPTGPRSGSNRVMRGGAYSSDFIDCYIYTRGANDPDKGYEYVGFRCVKHMPK